MLRDAGIVRGHYTIDKEAFDRFSMRPAPPAEVVSIGPGAAPD